MTSRRYAASSTPYTRQRGLDRETNKALLLRHVEDSAKTGTTFGELHQVLPYLSRDQVKALIRELKKAGKIESKGITKTALWFPAGGLKPNQTQ